MSSGEGSQGLTGWWSSGGMEHVRTVHSFSPPRGPPSPQIVVLIGIAHALVIYRVIATALFTQSDSEFLREQANTMAVMTGAVLHYITIVIMTKVRSETRGGQRVFSLLFLHQPSPVILLSCRSTGVWPSISVNWVRETGGCLPPASRSAELPGSTQDCGAAPPWSPNAARLLAPSLPPPSQRTYWAALAMQVPMGGQQPSNTQAHPWPTCIQLAVPQPHYALEGQSPYGAETHHEQKTTTAAGELTTWFSSQLKGPFSPSSWL